MTGRDDFYAGVTGQDQLIDNADRWLKWVQTASEPEISHYVADPKLRALHWQNKMDYLKESRDVEAPLTPLPDWHGSPPPPWTEFEFHATESEREQHLMGENHPTPAR